MAGEKSIYWYYVKDGETVGPVTIDDMSRLIVDEGTIQSTTKVLRFGMVEWVSAEETELIKFFNSPSNAPPPAVEEPAVEEPPAVEERMSPQPQSRTTHSAIWNPNAAANWSILFTPIFGAWLCAKNWLFLGENDKAKASMHWVYGGFLLILLICFIPYSAAVWISLPWLLIWYFLAAKKQINYVKEKLPENYERRSWLKPIGIAAACQISFAILFYLALFVIGFFEGYLSSETNLVKNGTMNGRQSTTIEKAFEGSFDKPEWAFFETEKGKKIVEFKGVISKRTHEIVAKDLSTLMNNNDMAQYTFFNNILINFSDEETKDINSLPFIAALNFELPGCMINDNAGILGIDCPDKATSKEYLDRLIDQGLMETWQIGAPVLVQWTINNDAETFELTHMSSPAWDGVEVDAILDVIYR